MPFNKMIEEVSSILWGLSIAVNIILLLIGLPLCLLICCCCRKHQSSIEKDIQSIVANHNLLGSQPVQHGQPQLQYAPQQQFQEPPQVNQQQSQRVPQNQGNLGNQENSKREGSVNQSNPEVRKRSFYDRAFTLDNDEDLIE